MARSYAATGRGAPPRRAVVVWLLAPLVVGLVIWASWYLGRMIFSGSAAVANHELRASLTRWFWPSGLNVLRGTGWGLILLIAWLAVGCWVFLLDADYYPDQPHRLGLTVLCVAMLVCCVQMVRAVNDNAKDEGRGYAGTAAAPATVFTVRDPARPPSFIADLTRHAEAATGGACVLVGRHDVPSCVARGDLPTNWDRRVVSIAAARNQMTTNSPSTGNTELRENTVGYLYRTGEDGTLEVKVSGVRDGTSGRPLHSVVEWDGRGNPTSCAFEGRYALDTSFNGERGGNLRHLIAARHPGFLYDDDDIWGYCDGGRPTVVVPGTRQVAFNHRTVLRPAGVLLVTGRDGATRVERRTRIAPGDLPGPAYPITLVIKQRLASSWAAGEGAQAEGGFGFELPGVSTQSGNIGVFQLRSRDDGRRYWVSPMRARGSDSEQLVAYSVTPADSVDSGTLNTQRIYVLDDGDQRITALTRMENRIKAVLSADPGFFPTGGRIVEFVPLDALTWQAYGEVDGQVKYLFTVPVDESRPVTAVNLTGGVQPPVGSPPSQPGGTGAVSPCADFATATREQLRECAFRALEEDRRRGGAVPGGPAASPSR